MNSLEIRLAGHDDCKDIFEWRNDKLTRQMSKNIGFVEWKDHVRWFENCLRDINCYILLCENKKKQKVAVVRFEINSTNALVSINLAPNQRGKGYSSNCLSSSIAFLSDINTDVKILYAEIKDSNIASQKIFLSNGFEPFEQQIDARIYKKVME